MGLILNADDFGKNEEVSRAIAECFAKGMIDRTTLMVNMPYAKEAVEIARSAGFADRVGIHLNLTEGMPLTQPVRSNPLLCDAAGRFHAAFRQTTKYRLYMDQLSKDQIHTELKAQLDLYEEWGLKRFHVDSHHHVHTDYPIYCVIKRLAKEYHFSSIRLSRNLYKKGNPLMKIYKIRYNSAIRHLCDHTSKLFGSCKDLMEYDTQEKLRRLCNDSEIEIMMHPMYDKGCLMADRELPMEQFLAFLDQNGLR